MDSHRFTLLISVPEKVYFNKEVDSVRVLTLGGELTIMARHLDLVSPVEISKLTIKDNGHVNTYAVGGGLLNIKQKENKVELFLNSIESVDEINLERALSAKKKAEDDLANATSLRAQKKAEIRLKRALNRIAIKGNVNG